MAEEKKVPRHIGFIMDGNGRWAKLRGKSRSYGHKKGADVIEEVVSACFDEGVEAVSLYAFSTENWSRPKEEIDTIFDLLEKFLRRYENKLVNERIRLIISGDLSEISEKLRNRSISVMKNTERFVGKTLNIAINYGGRAEIVRAAKLLSETGEPITEENLAGRLYTTGLPDIDLVVRTSGESRLSNFFLWQCAYAELYFTDVLWPDFKTEELKKALDWFAGRKRRFGNITNA
ncbi:MAG: polyprenyl diphosphate synthase [Candidatus Borkfalkiaceae bacterium]|nr:polyprenyl diphosphate synthase [Eubacteriales bacterium]MDY5820143.1 polyprenyl diphosphate synthase [Christensenellaceae bacterium]